MCQTTMKSVYTLYGIPQTQLPSENWVCSKDCASLIDAEIDDIYEFVMELSRKKHGIECPQMCEQRERRAQQEFCFIDDHTQPRAHALLLAFLEPGVVVDNPLGGSVELSRAHPLFNERELIQMQRLVTLRSLNLGKFLGLWVQPWCRWVLRASVDDQRKGLNASTIPKVWELLVQLLRQPIDFNAFRIQGNTPAHWQVLAAPRLPSTTYTWQHSTSLKSPYFTVQLQQQHRAVFLNEKGVGQLTPQALAARLGKITSVHALLYSSLYSYNNNDHVVVPAQEDIYEAQYSSLRYGQYSCAAIIITNMSLEQRLIAFTKNADLSRIQYQDADGQSVQRQILQWQPVETLVSQDSLGTAVKGGNAAAVLLLLDKYNVVSDLELLVKVAYAGLWTVFLKVMRHEKISKASPSVLRQCLDAAIKDSDRVQKLGQTQKQPQLLVDIVQAQIEAGADLEMSSSISVLLDTGYPTYLFDRGLCGGICASQRVVSGNLMHLTVICAPNYIHKIGALLSQSTLKQLLLEPCGKHSVLSLCIKVGLEAQHHITSCIAQLSSDSVQRFVFSTLFLQPQEYGMNALVVAIGTYNHVLQDHTLLQQLERTTINADALISERDIMGRTPVMFACVTSQQDMLYTLEKHCDIRSLLYQMDKHGSTALHMAVPHLPTIQYIAKKLHMYENKE